MRSLITHFSRFYLAGILAIVAFFAASQAEAINPPRLIRMDLHGSTQYFVQYRVTFVPDWDNNTNLGYTISFANGETNDVTQFYYFTSGMLRGDSAKYNDTITITGTMSHNPFNAAVVSFYMTTIGSDSVESAPSNIIHVTYQEQPKVEFTSSPVTWVGVNSSYLYRARAKANDGSTVYYKALKVPQPTDVNVDINTGDVTWTPSQAGYYGFSIEAYTSNDGGITVDASAMQDWTVHVTKCQNGLAKIAANVKDENGNPIDAGVAYIFTKNNDDSLSVYGLARFQNGYLWYSELDEGTYYLEIMGDYTNYEGEWYDNSPDPGHATPIVVSCGDSLQLNDIVLKTYYQPKNYTVIGRVTRERDGAPVEGASVVFYGKNDTSDVVIRRGTFTNANGFYTLYLTDEYKYIAYTFVANDTVENVNSNLKPQYYKLVDDPTQATVIDLKTNIDTISFVLKEKTTYNNGFSGNVVDENNTTIANAYVIAYLVQPGPWDTDKIFTGYGTYTDSYGAYSFTSILPGKYVILAVPDSRDYMPGYYKENSMAVNNWKDGTQITVAETGNAGSFTVKLPLKQIIIGNGDISGYVSQSSGIIKNSDDRSQGSTPLSGALIYIVDDAGRLRDYTFSSSDGGYDISRLTKGKYTLTADRVGFSSFKYEFELKDNDSKLSQSVTLVKDNIQSAENGTDPQPATWSVYPNPAGNVINIDITGAVQTMKLSVLNAMGIEVRSAAVETGKVSIDMQGLPDGMYYIKQSGKPGVVPVAVIR